MRAMVRKEHRCLLSISDACTFLFFSWSSLLRSCRNMIMISTHVRFIQCSVSPQVFNTSVYQNFSWYSSISLQKHFAFFREICRPIRRTVSRGVFGTEVISSGLLIAINSDLIQNALYFFVNTIFYPQHHIYHHQIHSYRCTSLTIPFIPIN